MVYPGNNTNTWSNTYDRWVKYMLNKRSQIKEYYPVWFHLHKTLDKLKLQWERQRWGRMPREGPGEPSRGVDMPCVWAAVVIHVYTCVYLSKLYSCTSKRVNFIVYILNLNWADLEWLGFNPWVGKIPWRRKKQPTPVSLPGKFHGQKSLVGFSPWGHKQDTTEQLTEHTHVTAHLKACILLFTY